VNVTPPISGAVPAHGASPALPKNLSLADLLFADSPANGVSDFRAIAATLFGVESSTQTQSPANFAINAKKPTAGVSTDKPETRKLKETSDPASSGPSRELLVPLENIPVQPIQVSATPNAGDDRQLNSSASDRSTQLGLVGLPGQAQINDDASTAKLAGATPDDRILPSAFGEQATPMIQPTTENALKSGKQIATPIAVPTTGVARKKDVEPAKSPVDHSQPPIVPQDTKPPVPSVGSTDRANQSTNSSFSGGPDEPPVAIDALPATPPVEQPLDTPATTALDNVDATKAVPQSELMKPGTVAGSGNTSGRNASGASAKIKDRNIKDSRITPAQAGKPGFIPADQVLGNSSNSAGSGKDSSGPPLSSHSTTHAKPAALKQSADAPPSPASLMDTDGPDETLPTSTSSPVTAKFVQGMSQSEFRVGMQSPEFGNIDIRTSVARHMFSAQISVEHSDVAKSLTAQLPGLYHRLADQQVAVGNIVIHGQSLGTSSGLAQDAQRQSWQPQGHSADAGSAKLNAEPVLPVMTEGINSAGRLDIRI
jgi:flagellar hook-length control protein FliK